jgi:hypothetical protein
MAQIRDEMHEFGSGGKGIKKVGLLEIVWKLFGGF